jgi:hypothetical protein
MLTVVDDDNDAPPCLHRSYTHVYAADTAGCCTACSAQPACRYAVFQALNPTTTHRCWMMNATTLTPRPQQDSQLLVVSGAWSCSP